MGKYFRIIDKLHGNERTVCAPPGSQRLYDFIEEIVGGLPCPSNGIPLCIEADGWGELACIGETYQAKEFEIKCISEEEI